MKKNLNKRDCERRMMEIRAADTEDGIMRLEGYAIIYDQPATHMLNNRKFTETIKRGALDTADIKDVPMKYNHTDSVLIMARTRNHSLRLINDEAGLKIEADLIDTQSNRDLYKAIHEGLLDKMSFAFTVADGGDNWTFTDDEDAREVNNIEKLWDISVVDTPFYDTTSIYARSFDLLESEKKRLDSLRELDLLKEKIKLKGKI